jgi:hypothetical protein
MFVAPERLMAFGAHTFLGKSGLRWQEQIPYQLPVPGTSTYLHTGKPFGILADENRKIRLAYLFPIQV